MKQTDVLFWVWFAEAVGAGSDFRRLIDAYGSPHEIFLAESEELERIESVSNGMLQRLANKSLEEASAIVDSCERLGIGIMTYDSELYPGLLREIKNPPAVLYYLGTVPRFNELLCIGMVGTRRMSAYGMETAYKISYELASLGAIVVSGMAAGIDGVCAAAALCAGGTTVAVLGCGLDHVYPLHHRALMGEIAKKGLLLSEYPPGTRPLHYHFPTRNRIISGLSHGVTVVEAGLGSGSLITAKEAVMQGRDVFAVPSNVGGVGAEGTNGLLRDGAIFTVEAEDILKKYQYLFASVLKTEGRAALRRTLRVDVEYLYQIGVLKRTDADGKRETTARREATEERAPRSAKGEPKKTRRAERQESDPIEPQAPTAKGNGPTPDAVLQALSPVERAILQAMPDDRSVSADSLTGLGFSSAEIITALTMLELAGLLQKLPGSLYTKA